MKWTLVGVVVFATTVGQVLQAMGMKDHGEVHDFRPGALGRMAKLLARNWYIVLSIVCMAVSFFAFMTLVSIADVSFAVPATAASYVLEILLARWLLKEQISPGRWVGALLVAGGVVLLAR